MLITVLLCLQSSGAMAQTIFTAPATDPAGTVFPVRAGSLPSLHTFQQTVPLAIDPNPVGVFPTGQGTLPPVGFVDPIKPSEIDPLKPVETDVFGPNGLYDWLFPPEGGDFDSPLCPWKR